MIKHILVALVLVCLVSGLGSATTNILTGAVYVTGEVGGSADGNDEIIFLNNNDNLVGNITVHADYYYNSFKRYWGETCNAEVYIRPADVEVLLYKDNRRSSPVDPPNLETWGSDSLTQPLASNTYVQVRLYIRDSYEPSASFGYVKAYAIFTTDPIYHISGTTDCLSNVSLYYNNSGTWTYMSEDYLDDGYYSFNVTTGIEFKLLFDNGHSYVFNVTGNTVYNYNGCTQTIYRFEESCGNLIPDSEGYYCEFTGGVPSCKWFSAPTGIASISNSSATKIEVYTNTFIGQTGWIVDPVVADTTYTLENPNIAWGVKVIVQNESDGSLIDDAIVFVNQSCYCTGGTSIRQKKTVQGMVDFGDMSLQDASLFVMAGGYKILNENTTGYDVFLSGRSNFSSKTWIVKLANSNSTNSSSFYEVNETTNIYFRDVNNNITSKILDTDANVYLHYNNNNSNNEPMTLKFQSSSTHTYFIDEQSWNIPQGEIGYKTIANSYFTPWDYSYRAVMFNNSIYGWNITIPLTVRNGTRETDQHYQNLTSNLFFLHTTGGKIDYRDDIAVKIHARSNNTTLMNLDIELWKDGVYIACKNLTETILANTDYPYYYIWNPSFDYISGSNYSVRMYGFDRTLLETDYVDCITDNTTRKNKLTVVVKDYWGVNVVDTVVYLEGYGSIPTGTNYYASFEGLDNGYYRFKATKDGYGWAGWNNTTLSDADQTITYTLTESTTENLYTVTINVFNVTDVPLTNSTVYISSKGGINTGVNNCGVFYNVTEGTHTYKAGKSGYTTSTLTDINVDSNKNININLNVGVPVIVNYTTDKLTDTEVQDIYLPMMYLIFICILVGAFFAIMGGKF